MEGPIVCYMRLIDYNAAALTSYGTHTTEIAATKDGIETANPQFIPIQTYSSDVEQTLNIGSQSTGAGAGKITYNPLRITKTLDGISTTLFQNAASGTPYKTVEIFFVHEKLGLQALQTYKLVAVKSVSWAAVSGEGSVTESVAFEYGGFILTVYQQNTNGSFAVLQSGWNRVRNISDNDVKAVIL